MRTGEMQVRGAAEPGRSINGQASHGTVSKTERIIMQMTYRLYIWPLLRVDYQHRINELDQCRRSAFWVFITATANCHRYACSVRLER